MDGRPPLPAPPSAPPGLTSLPASVLNLICGHLPGREAWHLRSSCRTLRSRLADKVRKEHRRVYIMANAEGVGFLAAIAAGPLAKHVRLVIISSWTPGEFYTRRQEQRSFLGLGSRPTAPLVEDLQRGLDVPFIRRLAAALGSLPGLEMVKMTDYVWGQNPDGANLGTDNPAGHETVAAIFRGLVLALGHAHSADILVTELEVADCKGFREAAFALSASESLVAAPFLGQVKAIDIAVCDSAPVGSHEFSSFVSLCTSLVYLRLIGVRDRYYSFGGTTRLRFAEAAAALPCLEVLQLTSLTLPANDLIAFLSQPRLRVVNLGRISLTADVELFDEYRNKCKQWIGHPVIWDAVLRALSNHSAGKTGMLKLDSLSELPSSVSDGSVQFVQGNNATSSITLKAPECDKEDVYIRAASAIRTPPRSIPLPPDEPTTEPPLAHLPTDILHVICGDLDLRTVSNMRRGCLSLATALVPCFGRYLSTVTIVPSDDGLDNLWDIASSPFSPYVRQVVVTGHASHHTDTPTDMPHRAFLGLAAEEEDGREDSITDRVDESTGDEQALTHAFNTPFAKDLGKELSSLPTLEAVTLGAERPTSSWDPDRRRYRTHRRIPGGRPLGYCKDSAEVGPEQNAIRAVFRGVLFALAHTHAAGVGPVTFDINNALNKRGENVRHDSDCTEEDGDYDRHYNDHYDTDEDDDHETQEDYYYYDLDGEGNDNGDEGDDALTDDNSSMGLKDDAFSMSRDELEFVTPLLASPQTFGINLAHDAAIVPGPAQHGNLSSFISLCTNLVELDLGGVSAPIIEQLVAAQALPNLEMFKLQYSRVRPVPLVKLLSQWRRLRQVRLVHVLLQDDRTGTTQAPQLWDNVFRTVSRASLPMLRLLELVHLREFHADSQDLPIHKVNFKCGCKLAPEDLASTAILSATKRAALAHRAFSTYAPLNHYLTPCSSSGCDVEAGGHDGDLFTRAAALLLAPAPVVRARRRM